MRNRTLILIVLFSMTAIGQAQPDPVLFDEFGVEPCDPVLARVDRFAIQLRSDPTAKGLAVISGSREHLFDKLQLDVTLTSVIRRPGNDITDQLEVIRGKESGKVMVRFWLVPAGAEMPKDPPADWDLTVPEGTKPFYFHSDIDMICNYPTVYKVLNELLEANPKLRVNVVVRVWKRNLRTFRREVHSIREKFGAKSRRVRFFHERGVIFQDSNADFWLLP